MKILIADDNIMIRDLIKEILGAAHYYFEASDGKMAVEKFLAAGPDIVLLDIRMEKMDGIEAAGIIRRHSASVKIIMVTDYNEEILKRNAFQAGADGYLTKDNLIRLRDII